MLAGTHFALLMLLLAPLPAQERAVLLDAEGQPLALQTDAEIESFLRAATVVSTEVIDEGMSGARRVVLESDGLRLRAIFRDVELRTPARPRPSGEQVTLRDDRIFEVAAYRLDRLLGIERVPPVVERMVEGSSGTLQLWIENAETEKARRRLKKETTASMERAWHEMLLFDNLIFNDDRNRGNVLYDATGRLWMIDHTRAFRRYGELPYPEAVEKCERNVWDRLRTVSDEDLAVAMRPYLEKEELSALLQRRSLLVEHLERLIEAHGADEVLYSPR